MLHQELGRERIAEIRTEVAHNRLEDRLSKGDGSEKGVSRRSMATRGAAFVAALFR